MPGGRVTAAGDRREQKARMPAQAPAATACLLLLVLLAVCSGASQDPGRAGASPSAGATATPLVPAEHPPGPDGRAAGSDGPVVAPGGRWLISAGGGDEGPHLLRTRFLAGDDVDSLEGVWLAGLARPGGELPLFLAVTWSKVPAGWFGSIWAVHLATSDDLVPRNLNPAGGTGFLDGLHVLRLGAAQPRSGRLYETTLSYDPENGLLGVRFVDLATGEAILDRGLQLTPLGTAGALVPVAGFEPAPLPDRPPDPDLATPSLQVPLSAPGPVAGASRFTGFVHERGFVPLGIGWSIQQRSSPGAAWSRSLSLDRRLETRAEVRLPWDLLPGRLLVRAGGDVDTVLADVPAAARQLSIPIEIASLPAGQLSLALLYQSEHGIREVLEETVSMGRLELRLQGLNAELEYPGDSDGDPSPPARMAQARSPQAVVSGDLVVESDGPVRGVTLRLLADVATFDRDYWLASAVDGSVRRGALQVATVASDLVLIDDLALDVPAERRAIPFAAVLPLAAAALPDGEAPSNGRTSLNGESSGGGAPSDGRTPGSRVSSAEETLLIVEAPPPGGGWVVTLRPDIAASVPASGTEATSVWIRQEAPARRHAEPHGDPQAEPRGARDAEPHAGHDGEPHGGLFAGPGGGPHAGSYAAPGIPGGSPNPRDSGDHASVSTAASGELTVMVYNIRHGRGIDDVVDLERIASVIRSARPDIVALSEVDRITARTGGVDQAAALARMLDMHLAYGANIPYQGGLYGNAVMSRFPIDFATNLPLPSQSEQRGLLHVRLDVGGKKLHFLATHLGLSAAERELQFATIAEYVARLEGPVILGGDFNTGSGADRALGPGMRDAWLLQFEKGLGSPRSGLTFPSSRPSDRIDYIFLSEEIDLHGEDPVRTLSSLASDHLPVIARVAIIE